MSAHEELDAEAVEAPGEPESGRGPPGRARRVAARRPRRPSAAEPGWRTRRWRGRLLLAALVTSGVTVAAASLSAALELAAPEGDGPLGLDRRCGDAAFSCGIVAGLMISLVPIVIAVLTLLLWRLVRVRRQYRALAREKPQQLVEATTAPRRIVGRNGLCSVIQRSLQDRDTRRPHLLVGGIGVGKTAVLVHLTQMLAHGRAVPVPIRLRDAQSELDFVDLARRSFLKQIEPWLVSAAEGDKIWRRLREQDSIVVLADGLEDALSSGPAERSRDTAIRLAFAEAAEDGIPLVVTSRPHETLRYVDAAMLHLEPLSEGAALGFIHGAGRGHDPKVRLIVEQAEVVEAPLYMEVARELHEHGLLKQLDTRLTRRLALRIRLLDCWRDALTTGKLLPMLPHTAEERTEALKDLEQLAALGLAADDLEVSFTDLKGGGGPNDDREVPPADIDSRDESSHDYREVLRRSCSDVRQAARIGAGLEVVEGQSTGVRFRHSIVQAYLGSHSVGSLVEGSDYLNVALKSPGREVLMALVMWCFREAGAGQRTTIRDELLERARRRGDDKGIDMLAAAIEIDGMIASGHDDWLEEHVGQSWRVSRDLADDLAKLRVVSRLGDVGRPRREPGGEELAEPAAREEHADDAVHEQRAHDAFRALWQICQREKSYPVRVAAAQDLAAGGPVAFAALAGDFERTLEAARAAYAAGDHDLSPEVEREFALQGWVLPTLTGSLPPDEARRAMRLVRGWIQLLRRGDVDLSIESSWAQGFKFEANRRPKHADPAMRVFLAEQGELLLEKARFWFSQVSLLHAFTLWLLESVPQEEPEPAIGEALRRRTARRQESRRAHEVARRIVSGWERERSHPFADEAAALCVLAVDTREPGKYIWIDEVGVTAKLGPRASRNEDIANSRLWISPAAGWLALDERARQLVAEIIVTLNLAERTDATSAEPRLQRANAHMPLCLIEPGGRRHLQVGGNEVALGPRPGSTCRYGCRAHLCPYPRLGQQPFRGELSEAFCRDQQRILTGVRRSTAPWLRQQSVAELRDFWQQMEERSRV